MKAEGKNAPFVIFKGQPRLVRIFVLAAMEELGERAAAGASAKLGLPLPLLR